MQEEISTPFERENIQDQIFMETENFIAIYNIAPIVPGHSLIIPKKNIESFFEFSDEELCELILFSKNVIKVLREAFDTKAFNWAIQELEEAGQSVSHFHLHIIPRKVNDMSEPGEWFERMIDSKFRPKISKAEMRKVLMHIKNFVPQSG